MLSLNHLHLRAITEDDLDKVLEWRNSEGIRRYMLVQRSIRLALLRPHNAVDVPGIALDDFDDLT